MGGRASVPHGMDLDLLFLTFPKNSLCGPPPFSLSCHYKLPTSSALDIYSPPFLQVIHSGHVSHFAFFFFLFPCVPLRSLQLCAQNLHVL